MILAPGKVVLEAQDVVHLGAAPAIDGLVVIAHTADVLQHAVKCWLDVLPLPVAGEAGVRGTVLCPSNRSQRYCATLVS